MTDRIDTEAVRRRYKSFAGNMSNEIRALCDEVDRLRAALSDLADDVITRADARAALAGEPEPLNFTESGKVPQQPVSTIPDTTSLRDKDSSERCPTCGSDEPAWPYPRGLTEAESRHAIPCPHPWHRSTDTEGEK